MTQESASKPEHMLHIIHDDKGKRAGENLFKDYILKPEDAQGEYRRLPEFLIALDRLIAKFGGHERVDDNDGEEEDGDEVDSHDKEGEDDGDVDIHEASDVDRVKAAVASVLDTSSIFSADMYDWYRYAVTKTTSLTSKSGHHTVVLKKGSRFGVRPTTSKKGAVRLVTPELGLTIVFTLDPSEAARVVKNSKPE